MHRVAVIACCGRVSSCQRLGCAAADNNNYCLLMPVTKPVTKLGLQAHLLRMQCNQQRIDAVCVLLPLLLLPHAQEGNLHKLAAKGMAVMLPDSAAIRKHSNDTFQRQQVADTIRQVRTDDCWLPPF